MAKREFKGEPIDMTGLPGEQHISERNGETVDGTTEDDLGDEETTSWPSVLDRGNFSNQQQQIIEQLSFKDPIKDSVLADTIGCSGESVRQTRHKASVYVHPEELPFDAPESPTKTIKIVQSSLTEDGELQREESDTEDTKEEQLPREQMITLYEDGNSAGDIARKLDLDINRVCGMLGSLVSRGVIDSSDSEAESEHEEKDHAEQSKKSESVVETETESETESETDSARKTVELSTSQLVEILEARGVSSDTKEQIVQQGDF